VSYNGYTMKRAFLLGLSVSLFFLGVIDAKAQETRDSRVRVDVESRVNTKREDSVRVRDDVRVRVNDREERVTRTINEHKEEFEERRAEARTERDRKTHELTERLETLRDERKAKIVSRLTERLNDVNARWVGHWSRILERLSAIVDKLEGHGADVSGARAAIDRAQNAVNEQAGKVYAPEITEEETLGQDVRASTQAFMDDIRKTSDAVKEAREVVVSVLRELKSARNEQ